MPNDIYGDVLKPGYCRVHPHINELYPCRQCYKEQEEVDYEDSNEHEDWRYGG